MLKTEEWMDIRVLHREGHSIKQIARLTERSRNTIRRVLREAGPTKRRPSRLASKLDPFKGYAKQRFENTGLTASRIFEELVPMGYTGSLSIVRRYVHGLRGPKTKLTVRFETPPGKQAQADWAYCGRFEHPEGGLVPVYAFLMVLGFSRMLFVEFTSSMKLPELIRCHLSAFRFFGGLPLEVLYDNMRQVRSGPGEWHPLFLDFARHHGFAPRTHRVRRPRTKGKVERMVRYVKESFLAGQTFLGLSDLNARAQSWLASTANARKHATTGERPMDLWPKEGLVSLSLAPPYRLAFPSPRTASWEGWVLFERSRYSIPPDYAGKVVLVERQGPKIVIRAGDVIVAEHPVAPRAGLQMADPEHVRALWRQSLHRLREPLPSWRVRFDQPVERAPLTVFEEAP